MEDVILPVEKRVSRELDLEDAGLPLSLKKVFGNANPVELEIGIGKGYFLMNAALCNPDRNFLGIEIRRKYLNRARQRIEKRPIENIRLVCFEAFQFMEEFLPPQSLAVIHVYFPDPWPKKRHHKRRLFSQEFLALAYRLLQPGGELLVATDHRDYWDWIKSVMEAQDLLEPSPRLPEPVEGTEGLTNYEIKYQREGRPIYRAGYRKPG